MDEGIGVTNSSSRRRQITWVAVGVPAWYLIESLSGSAIQILPPTVPLVAGYVLWAVIGCLSAFLFTYLTRRFMGAPDAIWVSVAIWSGVHILASFGAWFFLPGLADRPGAVSAMTSSIARPLLEVGAAYIGSRVAVAATQQTASEAI